MKKKIKAEYGKNKVLIFDADLTNKDDASFATDLEAVAATKPKSLQDFLIRLAELQNFDLDEAGKL